LAIKIDFVAINMDRVINTKCDTIKTASGSFIDNSWRPINQLASTAIGQKAHEIGQQPVGKPRGITYWHWACLAFRYFYFFFAFMAPALISINSILN